MTTVIVGGVAGGMSAAARLRRLDDRAEIIVLERSNYVSYANCGLPYHIGGVIEDHAALLLATPESLGAQFGLDVRVGTEVLAIDRRRQAVLAEELATGRRYELAWEHLVLSPGAAPYVPDVPGAGRGFTLRTVEDMDRIVTAVQAGHVRSAVVVGGGFVGLEAAENLQRAGLSVSVVEIAPQVLAPLDPEMASFVQDELGRNGVALYLGAGVATVRDDEVELTDGCVVPADIVIFAVGVRPETDLASAAGLAIGPSGGIAVDEAMRTSDPHIYAIGDAVEKYDRLGGEPVLVPLANVANRQGRLVADAIAGRPRPFAPVIGTAIIKVFDKVAAVTGWNEKRLKAAGRSYLAVHTHPGAHAGYYPGGETMHLKLLVDPASHAILGAQGAGGAGVDKRIDVIATALGAGLRAPELADLELAYAPPFGSAKDPVNMLGYVAENRLIGGEASVQWYEVAEWTGSGAAVLDVRSPDEYRTGHIPGSINVPLDELRERWGEVPGGDVVVCCLVGQRSHTAGAMLRARGRTVMNLDGGYMTWAAGVESELEAELVPDPV